METIREAIEEMRRGKRKVRLVCLDQHARHCQEIGDEAAEVLAKKLAANTTLLSLEFYGIGIGHAGCAALAAAIQSPLCNLNALGLPYSRVGDEGCAALASAIRSPHSALAAIDLKGNRIGDDGCTALVSALHLPSSSLTTLFLGTNKIGDVGCAALASAIQSPHCKLSAIDLEENSIGDKGATLLSSALEKNTSLQHIKLRCNGRMSALVRAQILALVQLSRNRVADIPRDFVGKLTERLLGQVSVASYEVGVSFGEDTLPWKFERIADFAPILTALHDLARSLARAPRSRPTPSSTGDSSGGSSKRAPAPPLRSRSTPSSTGDSSGGSSKRAPTPPVRSRSTPSSTGDSSGGSSKRGPTPPVRSRSTPSSTGDSSGGSSKRAPTPPVRSRSTPSSTGDSSGGSSKRGPAPPVRSHATHRLSSRSSGPGTGPDAQPRTARVSFVPAPAPPHVKEPQDAAQLLKKHIHDGMLLPWSEIDAIVKNNEMIGIGGTGEVFRGVLRGVDVAVKVGARVRVKNELVNDFKREVRALCNIPLHPNIMPLKYVVAEKRGIALVFPLAENLEDACYEERQRGGEVSHEVLLYLYDIACGLRHIHAHGLEHRDLKPTNTFLLRDIEASQRQRTHASTDSRTARAVISDFGTAKLHAIRTTLALSTGSRGGGTSGTVSYMSPEQAAGTSSCRYQVTTKSDIWSYGHLVNELVTGKSPYVDEETDVAALVMLRVASGDFLPKADAALPDALQRLVNKCFRFNPMQRPSAHEICLRLEEMLCDRDHGERSVFEAYDKEEERMQEMFMKFARKLGLQEKLSNIEELVRAGNERGGAVAEGVQQLAEANEIIQQQQQELSHVTAATKAEFCGRMQAAEARLNFVQGALNR